MEKVSRSSAFTEKPMPWLGVKIPNFGTFHAHLNLFVAIIIQF